MRGSLRRHLFRSLVTIAATIGLVSPAATAMAQSSTPSVFDPATFNVALEQVASGFTKPVFVTSANDDSGRLFVVDQNGQIFILQNGKTLDTPFLDIVPLVNSSSQELGLLGLVFAPDYKTSGYFYVDYITQDMHTVVVRYAVSKDDPNVADPSSAVTILSQQQPYPNHKGGDLAFGPDGYLYISFGDGGSQGDPNGNGQNLDTWLAKILRIDVNPAHLAKGETYVVPKDNPFVGKEGAKPEIFVYGLRNPWRYSFDRVTHDLYIGDVGQDTYEEIDFLPAGQQGGQNFGWNVMEGFHCYNADTCDQSGITLPVTEYAHSVGGCSVTGGYVYRGSEIPALVGTYLFADYCTGNLWGMGRDASGKWVVSDPIATDAGISSFGEDQNGELYVTDVNNGLVYKVVAPAS